MMLPANPWVAFGVSVDDISVDVKYEIPTEAQIGFNVDTSVLIRQKMLFNC